MTDSSPAGEVRAGDRTRRPDNTNRRRRGGGSLDQLMPVVLFIVLYNLVNTETAVVASTVWSVKAAYSRKARGLPIGKWLPAITAYLLVRAAVTIAAERDLVDFGVSSEAVYFGIGIGTKMLIGAAAAVTIFAGRPFMVWAARKFVDLPESVLADPRFRATLRNVTWLIAVYEIGSSVWDIWLFNNSGVSLFLATRSVVNYVVSFLFIGGALLYMDRRLSPIEGFPGLMAILERVGPVPGRRTGGGAAGRE